MACADFNQLESLCDTLTILPFGLVHLAKPLEKRLGTRTVLLVCGTAVGLGLTLVPLATSPVQIAVIMATIPGPCSGIMHILSQVLPGRHFTKHFTLAVGIGHSGSAVAFMAFAPMTQLFLDTYGWRGALVLVVATCCHVIPCATLIKDPKEEYDLLATDGVTEEPPKGYFSSLKAFFADLRRKTDAGMLLESKFWMVLSSRIACTFPYCSWVVYYVPHLQAKGFSPQLASSLCSAAAVGYFFGSFILAPFVDRGYIRCPTGSIKSSLVLALTFVVDPWLAGVAIHALTVFVFGLSVSAAYELSDALVKEFLGVDRLTNAFAWIKIFVVAPVMLAGFVSGWIYDAVGSYNLALIATGCVPAVAVLPLIVESWIYDASGSYNLALIATGCVPAVAVLPLIVESIFKTIK